MNGSDSSRYGGGSLISGVGNGSGVGGNGVSVGARMESLRSIYGRCGVMTACLVDPLSQLVKKIGGFGLGSGSGSSGNGSGGSLEEMNAVGFYYEADFHGVTKMTVILFNIYDNDPIPWLRLGYTMELLLGSPFVTRIAFYPLVTLDNGPLLTRSGVGVKMNRSKLEETFRTLVIRTINLNASAIHDKNLSYTGLLLRIAGITGDEVDHLSGSIITGYTLVNKILLTLMGIEKADLVKISSSIIPCPLLKQPITISAPYESGSEVDTKYVIEESRREITKLVAVFVDLFTSHDLFRQHVLATRFGSSVASDNKRGDLMDAALSPKRMESLLLKLFQCEAAVVEQVVTGLQHGVISNATLNQAIQNLIDERFHLHHYQQLPISRTPQTTIAVVDEMMCTLQQSSIIPEVEPLGELGRYISHLVECFHSSEPLTVDLGTIIALYNAAISTTPTLTPVTIPANNTHPISRTTDEIIIPSNSNQPKISSQNNQPKIASQNNHTISRAAVVTLPGDEDGISLEVPINCTTMAIPMYNCNLTSFTKSQLLDLLVYVDSLRNSNGIHDTRFSNLQNEITHELAHRRSNPDPLHTPNS